MFLVVQTLLYPLHLAVLASLHAVLASSRCVRLISRLAQLLPLHLPRRRRKGPSSAAQDLASKRWSKLPRHLAVALVPGRGGSEGLDALRDKVDGVRRLLQWCAELGIGTLSVYDETGLLVRHAALVAHELDLALLGAAGDDELEGMATLGARTGAAKDLESCPPPSPTATTTALPHGAAAVPLPDLAQDEAGSASSSTLVDTPSPPRPLSPSLSPSPSPSPSAAPPPPTLHLLSRAAGRPRLARLATHLAASSQKDLTAESVTHAIDSLPLSEPDLLLVLGGSYLRLRGFPPWQLRLTELHHAPHPTWLAAQRVRYAHVRAALDTYGRAEMRLGR